MVSLQQYVLLKFATALLDLLFIGFPGIHLSHEMRVQLDNTSHTCVNLHVYSDDERQVLFKGDFARENFACTRI